MKSFLTAVGGRLKKLGYLLKAFLLAVPLGIIEIVGTRRGRHVLGLLGITAVVVGVVAAKPIRSIAPGEVGVRVSGITGSVSVIEEGWAWVIPGVHELRRYSLRDQLYRPASGKFQSREGLAIGVEVAVRYALNPETIPTVARRLPADVSRELVEPVIDGILHRAIATHTVREVFATQRAEIEKAVFDELAPLLAKDGVSLRGVFIGQVDLPAQYQAGLEALLAEELSAEKMAYTLELQEKKNKQSSLEADADMVRRQKAAEASGQEEVIAAKAKAEAMQHVLPLKEKQIEQKRLEAEADKVARLKQAEGEAEARRIEAAGEADSRRKLADSEAYRLEVTGKANSEQLARESEILKGNPLLIQKALADKLSDKIQVIIAPPQAGGFFAGNLLGGPKAGAAEETPKDTEE